jgi:hypothetical protein
MLPLSLVAKTALRKDAFPLSVSFLDVMHYLYSIKDLLQDYPIYKILNHQDNQKKLSYLPLPAIWSFTCKELVAAWKMKPNFNSTAHKCLNLTITDKLYKVNTSLPENVLYDWENFMNRGNYLSIRHTPEWLKEISSYLKGEHKAAKAKLNKLPFDLNKDHISRSASHSKAEDPKRKAEHRTLEKMAQSNDLEKIQVPSQTYKIFMVTEGVLTQYHAKGKNIQIYLLSREKHEKFKEEFEKEHNEIKKQLYGKPSEPTAAQMNDILSQSKQQDTDPKLKRPSNFTSHATFNPTFPSRPGMFSQNQTPLSDNRHRELPDFSNRSLMRPKISTQTTPFPNRRQRDSSSESEESGSRRENRGKLHQHRSSLEMAEKGKKKSKINTLPIEQGSSLLIAQNNQSVVQHVTTSFERELEKATSQLNSPVNQSPTRRVIPSQILPAGSINSPAELHPLLAEDSQPPAEQITPEPIPGSLMEDSGALLITEVLSHLTPNDQIQPDQRVRLGSLRTVVLSIEPKKRTSKASERGEPTGLHSSLNE